MSGVNVELNQPRVLRVLTAKEGYVLASELKVGQTISVKIYGNNGDDYDGVSIRSVKITNVTITPSKRYVNVELEGIRADDDLQLLAKEYVEVLD